MLILGYCELDLQPSELLASSEVNVADLQLQISKHLSPGTTEKAGGHQSDLGAVWL